MPDILLIEDDDTLRSGIVLALQAQGRVIPCAILRQTRDTLRSAAPDLLLLDIGLPDGSGLDFCREFRQTSRTPVIFLTASDTELDEVMGLEAGGDDCITNPFSLAILRAGVESALRRIRFSARAASAPVHLGDLTLCFQDMRFFQDTREPTLSRTEQRPLQLLVENQEGTLPRAPLLDRVRGTEEYVEENALSVAIRRLREKPGDSSRIRTVYGTGHAWEQDASHATTSMPDSTCAAENTCAAHEHTEGSV